MNASQQRQFNWERNKNGIPKFVEEKGFDSARGIWFHWGK